MLAQHSSVDGRANERLVVFCLCLVQLRPRQLQIGLGKRAVLLARTII
jgi:hypothetical protein